MRVFGSLSVKYWPALSITFPAIGSNPPKADHPATLFALVSQVFAISVAHIWSPHVVAHHTTFHSIVFAHHHTDGAASIIAVPHIMFPACVQAEKFGSCKFVWFALSHSFAFAWSSFPSHSAHSFFAVHHAIFSALLHTVDKAPIPAPTVASPSLSYHGRLSWASCAFFAFWSLDCRRRFIASCERIPSFAIALSAVASISVSFVFSGRRLARCCFTSP